MTEREDTAVIFGRVPRSREQIEALFSDTREDYWLRTWAPVAESELTRHEWHPEHIRMACAAPALAKQLLDALAERDAALSCVRRLEQEVRGALDEYGADEPDLTVERCVLALGASDAAKFDDLEEARAEVERLREALREAQGHDGLTGTPPAVVLPRGPAALSGTPQVAVSRTDDGWVRCQRCGTESPNVLTLRGHDCGTR